MDKLLDGYVDTFYLENIFSKLSFYKHGKNNRRCTNAILLTGFYRGNYLKMEEEVKKLRVLVKKGYYVGETLKEVEEYLKTLSSNNR